jgi:hypothetical protein
MKKKFIAKKDKRCGMRIRKNHGALIISIFKLLNQISAIVDSAGSSKGFAVEIHAKVN